MEMEGRHVVLTQQITTERPTDKHTSTGSQDKRGMTSQVLLGVVAGSMATGTGAGSQNFNISILLSATFVT